MLEVLGQVLFGLGGLTVGAGIFWPDASQQTTVLLAGAALLILGAVIWFITAWRKRRGNEPPAPPPPPPDESHSATLINRDGSPMQATDGSVIQAGQGNVNIYGGTVIIIHLSPSEQQDETKTAVGQAGAYIVRSTPRSSEELQLVLTERPGAWEYLYFVGTLRVLRDASERKYIQHEMRYAAQTDLHVSDEDAPAYLSRAMDRILATVNSLSNLFEPDVQARAFGLPGEPGDPERIQALAEGWHANYVAMLDWAAELRGTSVSSTYLRLIELTARMTDQPLNEYRAFLERFAKQLDESTPKLARGEPVDLQLDMTIELDPAVLAAFNDEYDKVRVELNDDEATTLIVEGAGYRKQLRDLRVTTQAAKDLTDAVRDWQVRVVQLADEEGKLAEVLLEAGDPIPEWSIHLLREGWRARVEESIEKYLDELRRL